MDYRPIAILIASGLLGGIAFNWPSDANSKAQSDAPEKSEVEVREPSPRGFSLSGDRTDEGSSPQEEASSAQGNGRANPFDNRMDEAAPADGQYVSHTADQLGGTPGPYSGVERDLQPEWSLEISAMSDGDRLLLGGNAVGAYQSYRHLSQRDGAADPALNLRMALSAEMAAMWEPAEEHYRIVLRNSDSRSVIQVQSLLGLARVWQAQGRLDVASQLLSEVALRFGTEQVPGPVRLATYHLLSECFHEQWFRAMGSIDDDPTSMGETTVDGVDGLYYWPAIHLEEILSCTEYPPIQVAFQQEGLGKSPFLQLVQKPSSDIHLILLDARTDSWSVGQVLSEFARQSELHLEVSSQARAALSGRVLSVSVQSHPAALLLDHALTPYDLIWLQEGDRLQIATRAEIPSETLQLFDESRIHRTLQHIQIGFPNSIERVVAFMHDGNLCLKNGELDNATNRYRSARELQPQGEPAAKLYFNQGLLELASEHEERALDLFYNALDQTLLPGMQSLAYGRIAALELAMGRPQKAVPSAARGLRLASGSNDAIANLLVLAKSYILDDDPYSANRILFENKAVLQDSKYRRIGALLSTYARYNVVKPMGGLQKEGERLVVALAAIQEDDAHDFLDALLIARAFHDVGIETRCRDLLSKSLEMAPEGYWSERVRLELVKMMRDSAEYTEALSLLNESMGGSDPLLASDRLLVRAELQSHLEQWEECRDTCEAALSGSLTQEQKKTALSLLGRSHQKLGKHYAAALCFAGFLPRDEANGERAEVTTTGDNQ